MKIDTNFAVGRLSKIADSDAFRKKHIYPKGVRIRGLFTTIRQGFRSIFQVVSAARFRLD